MLKNIKNRVEFEPSAKAMDRWNPAIKAMNNNDDNVIDIFSVIGVDYWTGEGTTAKSVNSVLQNADGADVTVNINSPGGDFFEGLAIHSLLAAYDGNVNVKIIGMAASAASIIAMAGDTVEIAESAFLMIHNTWLVVAGNKDDFSSVVDMLTKFDESMAQIYSTKTGLSIDDISGMMSEETWINSKDAVDDGFADSVISMDSVSVDNTNASAYNESLRQADISFAKAGLSRSKRRELIKNLTNGMPSAAKKEESKPSAGDDELTKALNSLLLTIKQ